MRTRTLQLVAVVTALVAVALTIGALASQNPTAGKAASAVKAGPAPTTPWGEPDLQGIWSRDADIPLQRPTKYGNREFLTDAERGQLDQQISGILARDNAESRRSRGTEKDVAGAYNAAIYTSHLRTGSRTSLIVDPPDGRVPPFTEGAQKARAALREYHLALLQATDTCKNAQAACAGGKVRAALPTPE